MECVLNSLSCVCSDESLLDDRPLLLEMLEKMMTARKFEEKVFELYSKGLLHGTIHLGIGEEAAGVGTAMAMAPDDYILVTHRGHCPAIGKGCGVNAMMAEILGKQSGTCHGRGGSMHIADFDRGILGANGIVGANAPLACGVAMTIKLKGIKDRVCAAFFGDGAANQGAVHESMNLAAVQGLPVIFCLVNNQYGVSMHISKAMKETDLTKRAAGYGMKAFECDGNDVLAVYEATRDAREYVLREGPCLLVEHTYRTSGHSKSDRNLYRSMEEIAEWEAVNPVARFSNFLLDRGLFAQEEIGCIDRSSDDAIEAAVRLAFAAPDPLVDSATSDVFA